MDWVLSILGKIDPFSYFALIVLLFMSIYSWAIILQKLINLLRIEKATLAYIKNTEKRVKLVELVELSEQSSNLPAAKIFLNCVKELNRLRKLRDSHHWSAGDLDIFLGRTSDAILADSTRRLEKRMNALASIGATAPFVGLFGTVTGVVNTLYNMGLDTSQAQFSNVAPGLSVALVATAFGLFVAIPAVLAFNYFRSKIRFVRLITGEFRLQILNKLTVPVN